RKIATGSAHARYYEKVFNSRLRSRDRQRLEHAPPGERRMPNARAGRVRDRVRDRGGGRDDRRLAEALDAEIVRAAIRAVDELHGDLRGHVLDRRHLVVFEVAVHDPARRSVDEALFAEREAERLEHTALDLRPRGRRIDDAADVVERDDVLDRDLADAHAELDLSEMSTKHPAIQLGFIPL